MFMNELPKSSMFEIILFATDKCFMLSDKNMKSMEKIVDNKLNKINQWLQINKLTLDHLRTNHVFVNKISKLFTIFDLQIITNCNVIKRVDSLK